MTRTHSKSNLWLLALCVLLAILLLSGCQARETNLALQQADQATEGAQIILAQKVAPVVAQLPDELQAAVKKALDDACQLLTSARESMRPALALTAGNEPAPETRTTTDLAVTKPADFIRQAATQKGRADIEVEDYLSYLKVGEILIKYGQAIGGDIMTQLLLLLGGGGATTALLAKGVTAYRSVKKAAQDSIAFGNDMAKANTDDDALAVIDKHKALQKANGTNGIIKKLGANSKEDIINNTPLAPSREHA